MKIEDFARIRRWNDRFRASARASAAVAEVTHVAERTTGMVRLPADIMEGEMDLLDLGQMAWDAAFANDEDDDTEDEDEGNEEDEEEEDYEEEEEDYEEEEEEEEEEEDDEEDPWEAALNAR